MGGGALRWCFAHGLPADRRCDAGHAEAPGQRAGIPPVVRSSSSGGYGHQADPQTVTNGNAHLAGDVRIDSHAHDGVTTNDHVQVMVQVTAARGAQPRPRGVDGWDASVEHLTLVGTLPWPWLTHLDAKRLGDPAGSGKRPIMDVPVPAVGVVVRLTGDGVITAVTSATPGGGRDDWAASDLAMGGVRGVAHARCRWRSEAYHRGSREDCGSERAQHCVARAQRHRIGAARRAFLGRERPRLRTGTLWCAVTAAIGREAIRAYLAQPRYTLISTA